MEHSCGIVLFHAKKILLEVHAGHGLTYKTVQQISKINEISEFIIGHFIVAESIFIGLKKVIINFKRIINIWKFSELVQT